jgi:hypothetical protein
MIRHLPYEEWILADEALPEDARRKLQLHLLECNQCRLIDERWQAARQCLREAGMQAPAAGFATRWKAMARQRLQTPSSTQAWVFLAASGLGSLALAAALAVQTSADGFSFSGVFSRSMSAAVGMLRDWIDTPDTLGMIIRIVVRSIPPAWYLLAVFVLSALGILGLLWFFRLTRRGKK